MAADSGNAIAKWKNHVALEVKNCIGTGARCLKNGKRASVRNISLDNETDAQS